MTTIESVIGHDLGNASMGRKIYNQGVMIGQWTYYPSMIVEDMENVSVSHLQNLVPCKPPHLLRLVDTLDLQTRLQHQLRRQLPTGITIDLLPHICP